MKSMTFNCCCGKLLRSFDFADYENSKVIVCSCGASFRVTRKVTVTIESLTEQEFKIENAKR